MKARIEGGMLTISALEPEWSSKAADILTAAFVDSNAAKLKVYRSEKGAYMKYEESSIVMFYCRCNTLDSLYTVYKMCSLLRQ